MAPNLAEIARQGVKAITNAGGMNPAACAAALRNVAVYADADADADADAPHVALADVALRGHAIEARLYAEDPASDFLPVSGRVRHWRPATGAGVRIDAGIRSGQFVSPFYAPMFAPLIAWGETRDQAIDWLVDALERTHLLFDLAVALPADTGSA